MPTSLLITAYAVNRPSRKYPTIVATTKATATATSGHRIAARGTVVPFITATAARTISGIANRSAMDNRIAIIPCGTINANVATYHKTSFSGGVRHASSAMAARLVAASHVGPRNPPVTVAIATATNNDQSIGVGRSVEDMLVMKSLSHRPGRRNDPPPRAAATGDARTAPR